MLLSEPYGGATHLCARESPCRRHPLTTFTGVKKAVAPLPLAVGLAVIALVALLAYGVSSTRPSRTLDARHDRDGKVIRELGVIAYPESFVVDRRGKIAALQRGPVDDRWMQQHVAPLLRS